MTIDMLGDEFLETVQMGDPISVREDGTVEVGNTSSRAESRSVRGT